METIPLTLSNGLNILVRETHHNPVVTVDAWIDTGALNEKPEINGVSHFLEHMLFKGTERRHPNELDLMIESVGGNWNAATSHDYTHYYCTVASPHKAIAMDAVADMLRNSRIDPGELEKERLVILEEYLRKQDSPWGLLWEELYELAFASGPYKLTVLGTQESIRGITREQMRDYFDRYYAPRNMVLIVSGDVTPDEARALAEEHFGDWEREFRPFDDPGLGKTAYQRGLRREIEKDVNETYYAMACPAPPLPEVEESIPLDVLETILGGGNSSRLHQALVERRPLAHGVDASGALHRHPGLFVFAAALDAENLAEFRAGLLEEVERFKQEGPTERELQRAKRMIFTQNAFSTETTTGQSGQIGYCYTLTGDTSFEEHYLDRLRAVSGEDVQRVARRYLDPEAANEVVVRPKG